MEQNQKEDININIRPPALKKNTMPPQKPQGHSNGNKQNLGGSSKYLPISNNSIGENSSRMKLRDYLYLAQTSSRKSASQNRLAL